MRRYAVGFVIGVALTAATTVYAGDAIKASLFPVKYEANGKAIELRDGFETLNYNNRAYVPVRFVAEALDTVVIYDDAANTIRLDDGFTLRSISSALRAGHVQTEKQGEATTVTAQLYAGPAYWESLYNSKFMLEPGSDVTISADLAFYDEEGKSITKVPVTAATKTEGDQLLEVEASTTADLSDYIYATLENVFPEPIYTFMPPALNTLDPTGFLALESTDVMKDGEFTKVRLTYMILQQGQYQFEAEIICYDEAGNALGSLYLDAEGIGSGISFDEPGELHYYTAETVGKGDFTKAAKTEVVVKKKKKVTEVLTK